MREFLEGPGCLMEFLRRELDDPQAAPCGRCARCLGHALFPHAVDAELARDAVGVPARISGSASSRASSGPTARASRSSERAEPGRILGVAGDGGWSAHRRRRSERPARTRDELVEALVELTRGKAPDPVPTWVTCVPSLRQPELVPSLAARFAARLRLPFRPVVAKTRETAPQAEMDNSPQQYAQRRGRVRGRRARFPKAPVYLVDDIVDSRWTLTVVAALLRQAGAGPVFPLALAQSRSDDGG